MIICVCANVSERKIKSLETDDVSVIMLETGAGMNCGRCFEALKQFVEDMGPHVPLGATMPCKHCVEGSTPFGSTKI